MTDKIAIIALGRSSKDYVMHRVNSAEFDEIWGINAIGGIFHVDRTFMMDPAARFLDDDRAGKQTEIARKFLLETPNKGPIYSCCLDERVPEIELYPLEDVIRDTGYCYFNNTVAYAVAYAIHAGVKQISFYGVDFSYRENLHIAEAGRACVEFWCAMAINAGIEIQVAPSSTLLDTNVPEDEKLYGYHRLEDPLVQRIEDGAVYISPKSLAEKENVVELMPPEPLDSILVGRHDTEGS